MSSRKRSQPRQWCWCISGVGSAPRPTVVEGGAVSSPALFFSSSLEMGKLYNCCMSDEQEIERLAGNLSSRECGKRCRVSFGELQKQTLGTYTLRGRNMIFRDKEIFVLYSDFHPESSQWYYGIPQNVWDDWQNRSLAFLMKDGGSVQYALLNPQESETLIGKCGQDRTYGQKEVNIRMPVTIGKIHIVEWREFPLSERVQPLHVSWT